MILLRNGMAGIARTKAIRAQMFLRLGMFKESGYQTRSISYQYESLAYLAAIHPALFYTRCIKSQPSPEQQRTDDHLLLC